MNEIGFEITRTKGDYLSALLSNLWRNPAVLAWCAVGSIIVAGIAMTVNAEEPAPARFVIGGVALAAMLGVYALSMSLSVLLAARKSWTAPGALGPINFKLSAEGLFASTATANGLSAWSNWRGAFETRSQIVIRHHLGLIQIFPKKGLTPDVLRAIRKILADRLGARAGLKGGSA